MRKFFSSRKNWQCMVASLLFTIPLIFSYSDFDKQGKQYALTTYIIAVAGVWGINIGATGLEDYSQKKSVAPSQQVNVGQVDRPIGNIPVQDNQPKNIIPPVIALICLFLLAGCTTCPDKIILREALDQTTKPVLAEDIDLVRRIATSQPLPKFDADDVRIRENYKAQIEGLINDDRAHDNIGILGGK